VISDGAQCLNTIGHMQAILYTGIQHVLFRKLLRGLYSYRDYSRIECTRATEDKSSTSNVLHHLLSAKKTATEEPLFTPLELQSECSLLIIAGSDTTSTCLAATLFYLLHNPVCLLRVQKEVRIEFETEAEMDSSIDRLKKCKYLRACIDESLRLSPPVGGLMPREVSPGGMIVEEHYFPPGTEIGTPHYALQHNAKYFPDSFAYKPDRWLVNAGDDAKEKRTSIKVAESAFCAFSVGPRNCIGKTFAYQELMAVLAKLLWRFEMRLKPGEGGSVKGWGREMSEEFQLWDTFASRCDGPFVEFKRR